MPFNCLRSFGEQEAGGVEETYQIWFPLSFFCLPFVFLYCFSFSLPLSSVDYHTIVTFICGDAGAPCTGFLLLRLAYVAKEGPKTEVLVCLWWSSSGQGLSVTQEGFSRHVFRAR